MAHRKSGFVRRGNVMRRATLWLSGVETVQASSTTSSSILTSLNAGALALRPFTIIRTRGMMSITSDQGAATERYAVALGGIVVTDEAVAAGVASVPTPSSEDASDWYFYERLANELQINSSIGFVGQGSRFKDFDSKAMRKVDIGQDAITVQQGTVNNVGVILLAYCRTLVKLH